MAFLAEKLRQHNRVQQDYYEGTNRTGMRPRETPYLRRHVQELLQAAHVKPGDCVLEIGCGMGRYTLSLAKAGLRVTAMDLSQWLLDRLQEFNAGEHDIDVHCGDVVEHPPEMTGQFDAVVGLFMLHHVHDLPGVIAAMSRLTRPGGRVVLLEPNPYNPLYYIQIAITPHMRWEAEKGLLQMRPRCIFPAMTTGGLENPQVRRFGYFPPFVTNRPWGQRVERVLEAFPLWKPALPFQVYSAEKPTS